MYRSMWMSVSRHAIIAPKLMILIICFVKKRLDRVLKVY